MSLSILHNAPPPRSTSSLRPDEISVAFNGGIFLPELDLWLDPHRSRGTAVITHAHSDHARRHRVTLATAATHALLARNGKAGRSARSLAYGERSPLGQAFVTLFPAGHVLGSAQVLVEHEGHRLLYSGDLKLRPSLTAEPARVPRADTLIVESTYGRPQYRFPPAEEVLGQLEVFCREALNRGETPVVFAYSLGKSQEVLAALGAAGLPLSVSPAIDAVSAVYRQSGAALPAYETLEAEAPADRVLLLPPQARRSSLFDAIERPRTAVVTGWALDRGASYRFRCDAAFPLSDHADYEGLLEYVERVTPSRVYTVHGFTRDLARDLRARGHQAFSLSQPEQLQLF